MIGYRDLRCSTENSTQYSVMVYVGKKSESEWMCWSSRCGAAEMLGFSIAVAVHAALKRPKRKKKKKEWMGVYA